MQPGGVRLSIDCGGVSAVAVLSWPDGRWVPLLFDGVPQLPAAVYVDHGGGVVTGAAAWQQAAGCPERFVPAPLRRPGEGRTGVGAGEVDAVDLVAAILRRVAAEATRVAERPVAEVRLVVPAGSNPRRRTLVRKAAHWAGLGQPSLVEAPVAAAQRMVAGGTTVLVGAYVLVCDFGGGFEASVLRRAPTGFEVLSTIDAPDAGGAGIDEVLADELVMLGGHRPEDGDGAAAAPLSDGDRVVLLASARTAKETLTHTAAAVGAAPGGGAAQRPAGGPRAAGAGPGRAGHAGGDRRGRDRCAGSGRGVLRRGRGHPAGCQGARRGGRPVAGGGRRAAAGGGARCRAGDRPPGYGRRRGAAGAAVAAAAAGAGPAAARCGVAGSGDPLRVQRGAQRPVAGVRRPVRLCAGQLGRAGDGGHVRVGGRVGGGDADRLDPAPAAAGLTGGFGAGVAADRHRSAGRGRGRAGRGRAVRGGCLGVLRPAHRGVPALGAAARPAGRRRRDGHRGAGQPVGPGSAGGLARLAELSARLGGVRRGRDAAGPDVDDREGVPVARPRQRPGRPVRGAAARRRRRGGPGQTAALSHHRGRTAGGVHRRDRQLAGHRPARCQLRRRGGRVVAAAGLAAAAGAPQRRPADAPVAGDARAADRDQTRCGRWPRPPWRVEAPQRRHDDRHGYRRADASARASKRTRRPRPAWRRRPARRCWRDALAGRLGNRRGRREWSGMVRAAAVMRRLMGGVWSLGWLAILLVGVPAALVGYVGWPLPDHWPTRPEWERWVQQPLTRPAVIGGFAVLIWLMWAALVYALLVEVLTRVRRLAGRLRGTRLPPLPTPMQATASGMLGAAVFAMPAGAAHPPTPPAGSPPAAAPGLPAGPVVPADAVEADHCVAAAVDAHPPDTDPDPAAAERGVTLPDGGWVSDQTAHAIAAVAAMVWWQRRRRYLPRPPTGAVRDDPDLAPLPPAATAVQDILHGREHPDDLADGGDRPPAGGLAVGEPAGSAAVAGDRAATAIGPGDLPAGGVGLTGPGALAAGRGILTAVLVSAGTGPHDNDARLVTTGADLHTLLGPDATVHHDIPGMIVADGLDEAIALLEQHVLARGRAARHARHGSAPPATGSPPLVLLTCVPAEPATAARLAVLLLCAHLGVAGALLGDWPQGDTWRIDEHGYLDRWHVAAAKAGRLCVLTPTATADLLTVLREARPHPPPPPPPPLPPPPALVRAPPLPTPQPR